MSTYAPFSNKCFILKSTLIIGRIIFPIKNWLLLRQNMVENLLRIRNLGLDVSKGWMKNLISVKNTILVKKYGPIHPILVIHPVLTCRCLCPPIADKSDSPGSLILCLFFGKVFPLLGFQIQISKAITLHTVDCVWILSPQIPFTKSARF